MIDIRKRYPQFEIADIDGRPSIVCSFGHVFASGTQLIAVGPFDGSDRESLLRRQQMLEHGLAINDSASSGALWLQFSENNFGKISAVLKPVAIGQTQTAE
jgi:hypothetical protein